jgi:preprotein translocase subunit SecF
MFEIISPHINIDFVGKRKLWMGISIACILATAALFFTKGLNYGIDFTGGAEVQLKAPNGWDIGKLRDSLEKGGFHSFKVQQIGLAAENQYLVKTQGDEKGLNTTSARIEEVLKQNGANGGYEIQRVDVVGPAAGSSLRMSGFLSMLYALLCILIYVAIRFDTRYAPGAVLALFHDTVITIGIFILTQKQFDLQILAAILALIGYSNNDTIIVYDRVRETILANPKLSMNEAVNKAINETLGRTILTSLATFLTVFSLWLLGGKVIEDFAFTLMVGIIVGAYSSIFIASSIVIYITDWMQKKDASEKASGKSAKRKHVSTRPQPKLQ